MGHPDDVEVVRRIYEAFNRRDIDTVVALAHPDIEVHALRTQSPTAVHGRAAFRALLEHGVATGRTHRYLLRDVYRGSDGRIVVVGTMVEHELESEIVSIHRMQDGLSRHVVQYFSDEQTLRDLKLI